MPTPDLQGWQDFRRLGPVFEPLHAVGIARERAGNRPLFDDQYAPVLRVSFFNPTVTRFRGLQQTTTRAQVQARCGLRRTSLRARSAAASVFDAAWFHAVRTALGAQLQPPLSGVEPAARASLTAVDGSLLPALPRRLWALWQDDPPRAAKRPVAFAVRQQGPVHVTVTAGNASERVALRRLVQPGGVYVFERGYTDDDVFQELQEPRTC